MEFNKVNLRIDVENASILADPRYTDPKEFAMIRRNGFGASDSAALLGVSPYTGLHELIEQKCSTEVTEDELKIGLLPQVRMGAELEPFILSKFEEWFGAEVIKPKPMYRMAEYPYLTVNYDGLTDDNIPVEVKCISFFGEGKKDNPHWRHDYAMTESDSISPVMPTAHKWSQEYCKMAAKACGVPVNYYTQCQQQILGVNSDHCYLAAMHTKDWTLRVYYIPRDDLTINQLIVTGYKAWNTVKKRKGL